MSKYLHSKSFQKTFFATLFAIFFSICIFYAYSSWRKSIELKAHKDLSELLERYQASMIAGSEIALKEIQEDALTSLKANESSRLAAYFLACHAQCKALFEKEAAISDFEKVYELIKSKNDTYMSLFFKISFAHNLLMNHPEKNDLGLKMLKECCTENQNPLHEMGLYLLGLYFFEKVSLAEADKAWSSLVHDPKYINSPWREYAIETRLIS